MCKRTRVLALAVATVTAPLLLPSPAKAVESIHYGYIDANAPMTDSLRLSTRVGTLWWSANRQRTNAENGTPVAYAYHDGYVENSFTYGGVTHTATEAAARWRSIMTGNGDPWTGQTGAQIGTPGIIILDELTTSFTDGGNGTLLRNALQTYLAYPGATRNDIAAFLAPSFSQSTSTSLSNYDDVVYSANNYLRSIHLELYAVESGYNSGGENYLASQLGAPIRRWTTTWGVNAARVAPTLLVSNFADDSTINYAQFLNRQFHNMANGWYQGTHANVDANVKQSLRNGVSSYTWTPGTNDYQLLSTETLRDAYFEEFLSWYSVPGNTSMDNLWTADASGTWSTGGNWLTASAPGGIDSHAKFLFPITQPRTVTLDTSTIAGHVVFDNPSAYTLAGGAPLTMQVSSGSSDLTVRSGSHVISTSVIFNSSTTLAVIPASSTLTLSAQTAAAAGIGLTKSGDGKLQLRNARATSLNIVGGTIQILANGTSVGASKLGSLSIPNPGRLDLQDNKLIVTSTPIGSWNGSVYTGLIGLVASGRNGGTWDGSGIVTSRPEAQAGYTSLAIATAGEIGRTGSNFAGFTVSAGDVLVMYTYGGDADLSGNVDIDDYTQIDSNASLGGILTGWVNGDFDYNGISDIDDYTIIDSVIGIQGPPFSTSVAVELASTPEAGSLTTLSAGGALLLARRRLRSAPRAGREPLTSPGACARP